MAGLEHPDCRTLPVNFPFVIEWEPLFTRFRVVFQGLF